MNAHYLPLVDSFKSLPLINLVSPTFDLVELYVYHIEILKPIKTVTDFGAPSMKKITSHQKNYIWIKKNPLNKKKHQTFESRESSVDNYKLSN